MATSTTALREAAKRKIAPVASTAAKKASAAAKKKPAPKPVPVQPRKTVAPVANPNGKIVSPTTWKEDQQRLTFAPEDQATWQDLNTQENTAIAEYNAARSRYQTEAGIEKVGLQRQQDEMNKQNVYDRARASLALSARGLRRGATAARSLSELGTQQATAQNALNAQFAENAMGFDKANPEALARRDAVLGSVKTGRQALSQRAAAGGRYTGGTVGLPSSGTGVRAPSPVSKPPVKKAVPKKVTPKKTTKKKKKKPKSKTSLQNAAKRRAAAKKKGK